MKKIACFLLLLTLCRVTHAQTFVSDKGSAGTIVLSDPAAPLAIYTDAGDDWLVNKSAALLQEDLARVTARKPALIHDLANAPANVVIIGTIKSSPTIRRLAGKKIIDTTGIGGRWETFRLQTNRQPFGRVRRAFVICGSDKRGVAYGVFELSKQLGVSPWYWWADVPVQKRPTVFIRSGIYTFGAPTVKYRGIFINDEAPAFSGWAKEHFGGINHLVYEKVFELLLRLRGNYLWPAMWGNAFNDDDTLSPVLADKWGIVMGTSHHEPMLRAQQEWKRYGRGQWNYDSNAVVLRDFWRDGIRHMGRHESIVTVGMRGDGDLPMAQGTAINLLERIVDDQRRIITDITGRPAAETPQLWALYKEVQDYYDRGMRVPDDVTPLLCDDNWGNLRKLPRLTDKPRSGGYGIYYHFDYVGGPRNYKWINTNNLARVWEQMHLAWTHGVDRIWIVNVGDLKPMELPISFFLDYAWDARKWNEDNIDRYYAEWAGTQFGRGQAEEIGGILSTYSQLAARRKPELLDTLTYSITNGEAQTVVQEWDSLWTRVRAASLDVPDEYADPYFELVAHPVLAERQLQWLYFTAAQNHLAAERGDPAANNWANLAMIAFRNDSILTDMYHRVANGKWNHMMDQTHIGYTYWQQPPRNVMPHVYRIGDSTYTDSIPPLPNVDRPTPSRNAPSGSFYEYKKLISMQATHWSRAVNDPRVRWKAIPGIGRDGDGVTTFPVTDSMVPASAHLEYVFDADSGGDATVTLYFSPTLNFNNDAGLRYAISIDDEAPQVFSLNGDDRKWNEWVANNIILQSSTHRISRGRHVLKYRAISPAIILQKLVVNFGNTERYYLGPPETRIK